MQVLEVGEGKGCSGGEGKGGGGGLRMKGVTSKEC